MSYVRKTTDEFTIQGNYGQGWENVITENTYKEARDRLKEYNENEHQYAHKLIKRRIKLNVGVC